MATSPTERCAMCEKPLVPGLCFPLPNDYPDLKRWTLGLFPSKPDEFELFIEHIRLLKIEVVPYLCSSHFTRNDFINERGKPLRLCPQAIPQKYDGSMRIRMEKLWQRRKCVVCGALRPSDEMYPFTQKKHLVSIWCENIHPRDAKTSSKLLKKVMTAVSPTLCGEHFSGSCFDHANDLKPNSVPTMADIRTTASVMSILNKAKADLQKVLPGDFIPRDDIWDKIEDEAASSPNRCYQNMPISGGGKKDSKCPPRKSSDEFRASPDLFKNELDQDMEEESTPLFDNYQTDEIKKEEDAVQVGEIMNWGDAGSSVSKEDLTPPPSERPQRKRTAKSKADISPARKSRRSAKVSSPEVIERRTEPATVAGDSTVTTRSGRTVKRKVDYDEPVRKERTKRPTKDPVLSEAHSRSIKPLMELIYSDTKSGGGKRAAAAESSASSEAGRILPVRGTSAYTKMMTQPEKNTRIRPIINNLQVQKIKCSQCRSTAEATIFGMKEHAREHCTNSLKCPFDDCPINFSANKRSKVSYHTQTMHRQWAFPIDLSDRDSALEKQIQAMMQTCFPSAMNRANEPGSVSCSICSMVVSPEYRSLYSHVCLHLPSRPYGCSECPTFEAYTEEEIDEHHRQQNCNGDVMSNMDDAISALAEKLFKTAFPTFVHLLGDRPLIEVEVRENSEIQNHPQPLPTITNHRMMDAALVIDDLNEMNKVEWDDEKLMDFPDFIQPEDIVAMTHAGLVKFEEEKKEVTVTEHDHPYCVTL